MDYLDYIKIQINRFIKNRVSIIPIVIGIVLIILISNRIQSTDYFINIKIDSIYYILPFKNKYMSSITYIYIITCMFIAPILGNILEDEDYRRNIDKIIVTRISNFNYKRYNLFNSFLYGGILAVIPFIMVVAFFSLKYPFMKLDKFIQFDFFVYTYSGNQLYYTNPFLLLLEGIVSYFLLGATFSLLYNVINIKIKNIAKIILCIFIFTITSSFAIYILGFPNIIITEAIEKNTILFYMYILIILIVACLFYIKFNKDDNI